jgi:hypothetical protein
MKKYVFLVLLIWFFATGVQAQSLEIKGVVVNSEDNLPIAGVKLSIYKTDYSATSDKEGKFTIVIKEPGFYSVTAEATGYKSANSYEQLFTFDKQIPITIELVRESSIDAIGEVNIRKSSLQKRSAESPLSSQELSIREIERNPGGNRDISKIIQSLPGVISIPGFRNDVVIRGGAPSENKFYLDGIEIPVINHFQTQGSTGGPVGLLNVNFIKSVNLSTGAFPLNYSNGLSSVLEFQQIEGNKQKGKYRFTVGSSDLGLTADGPIGKKATYIFSARQSYLQGLFSLLGLPFLPNFIDYQGKLNVDLGKRDKLAVIVVGAFDFFRLNTGVNDRITDSLQLKSNKYILGYLPDYNQWNYAFGTVYTHLGKRTKTQVFLSRNMLYNETNKYKDNDESRPENLILNYVSTEEENKLRVELSGKTRRWKWMVGGGSEYAQYGIDNIANIVTPFGVQKIDFESNLEGFKYSAFGRISGDFKGTLISGGLRFDGANYGKNTRNPLGQPTVSLSASVPVAKNIYFNANIGQFHQLPTYSIIGYRVGNALVNRDRIDYIRNRMVAAGFQYNKGQETKITVEGFYKHYSNYPFALNDSISLANLGVDFAVVGNEPVSSFGRGRAYGAEFLIQRRSRTGLYGIASYTLAWSQFEDKRGQFVESSWDSRHTVSLTAGKKLKKNWEIGAKWRFVTGRPYTPDDIARSMQVQYWDVRGIALPDYNRLNSARLSNFNQFDIRVDKVWYKKKWSLDLYFDIQNFFNAKFYGPETLIAAQDNQGNLIKDPNNPGSYQSEFLPNESGTVLPTIGIILDF